MSPESEEKGSTRNDLSWSDHLTFLASLSPFFSALSIYFFTINSFRDDPLRLTAFISLLRTPFFLLYKCKSAACCATRSFSREWRFASEITRKPSKKMNDCVKQTAIITSKFSAWKEDVYWSPTSDTSLYNKVHRWATLKECKSCGKHCGYKLQNL